ncbi:hypothetical protein CHS0354_032731, partial [Potamilus streckersoni]
MRVSNSRRRVLFYDTVSRTVEYDVGSQVSRGSLTEWCETGARHVHSCYSLLHICTSEWINEAAARGIERYP